ncbi:GDSL esterase/lipase APG-like [Macadamia integrifolia]|uniref:GDSL esterase/lipase APG-like n=1 Tax=Macadamia integrifolia TaxID=60698 RepID=UPI001C4F6F21|nr:GDSL esterase/lipase APG-like [Macadamia integrifolia]
MFCDFFDLCPTGLLILLLFSSFAISGYAQGSTTLVPAIITFGDSSVDVGNNDYLATFFKADFPPYGRDFTNHKPTGRFCNGKLATDITAENLGFTTYPPAYLSPQASGKNLLIGANFASAGSGYYEKTAYLSHTISLAQQLQYYKEYQGKLTKVAGSKTAASIIKDALYLVGAGNSDFLQNYYVNPLINKVYTPDQFSSFLVGIFSSFVKDLYGLGARRIGVTSLPPLGCLPAAITLFGQGKDECESRLNTDAQGFNKKINAAASTLQKQLPGLSHRSISYKMFCDFFGLCPTGLLILLLFSSFAISGYAQGSTTLVPAIITFGDSSVDVGNNDYLATFFKADFPPYGRDFTNHKPTGRFCNGKLATDITAENLGFTTYPPAYLSPQASGKNLLIGANFASAGSGYYEKTAYLSHTISLAQQLQYYKEYQGKLTKVAGSKTAASIIKDALYLVGAGNSDFLQNYYVNPLINKVYTPDQFSSFLVGIFSSFVKDLYGLGARRIGVTSLPPLGCLPAAITLFGQGKDECESRLNTDAQGFNKKINAAASTLQKQLPGLKIAILDIYTPLLDAINSPSKYGFSETRRGCCGTGTVETTSFLCNPKSPGTCNNATQYVFWDSVHPSQAAYQVIADAVIIQGISLIG